MYILQFMNLKVIDNNNINNIVFSISICLLKNLNYFSFFVFLIFYFLLQNQLKTSNVKNKVYKVLCDSYFIAKNNGDIL